MKSSFLTQASAPSFIEIQNSRNSLRSASGDSFRNSTRQFISNKLKALSGLRLVFALLSVFLTYGSAIAQCPVTPCDQAHITTIDIDVLPICGQGSTDFTGDIQGNQTDCKNGPNNCHEFIIKRSPNSLTQQITLQIGQGNGCNGELDATFAFIDDSCYTLSNGGSQTVINYSFPANVDTAILFLCLNSSAFVSICDFCRAPPPCDALPLCNLSDVIMNGCEDDVPIPFTNPADVFTNIPTCNTVVILDHEDVGDTDFCLDDPGVDFIRTYTLYFLDTITLNPLNVDTFEYRTCEQLIQITPTLPSASCQDITVSLDISGMVTISASQIDMNSVLGCGGELSATPTTFDCEDEGPNIVTLTVTDECGRTSTCAATVTIAVPAPTAMAGADMEVCEEGQILLNGTATNGNIMWTSDGFGTFSDPTLQDPIYFVDPADPAMITLTMTVTGICTTVVDQVILSQIVCECDL